MKPVRLPASATNALPRWVLLALCTLYILPGLIRRDPWKSADDGIGFGIMWTMAHGGANDWLWPHIAGLPMADKGPLAFWTGAFFIELLGPLLGDVLAARVATIVFFLLGCSAVWYTTYLLGRRTEAQPLKLAFGGQPEARDYGRTLADGALLIYLGCLGLLLPSHTTSAEALQVSLIALTLYATVRLFDSHSLRAAATLGVMLGLLTLTRGWIVPLTIWLGLLALASMQARALLPRLLLLTLPLALLVPGAWVLAARIIRPFNSSPFDAWMLWNYRQLALPSLDTLGYFLKTGIWFTWPAWPFAGWAVYAWRRQYKASHIVLPLVFFIATALPALLNVNSEQGILIPMLPSLVILAAFGLPTMKRGAINAVDWFSVMSLTTCAVVVWIGWIAKQTGWPTQLARNAFKLAPGYQPEFNAIAFLIAFAATAGWLVLVQWRISRHPSVLWRAVVLSSGGIILCWTLFMTLWLPWGNYKQSYAGVAREIAKNLPPINSCVDSNVGPTQRASFAYFGNLPFARFDDAHCEFLLLQDNNRGKEDAKIIRRSGDQWKLLWEGRRPSDRDERYRLYQRID
jgi:4-amino-4-deoxy-L-arabinose transferase-like glycosyltransferase